jgi:outer membrane protein assembly factor BamB
LDNTGQPVSNWPVQLSLSDVSSTPALCADGIVYATTDNDTMYAVRDDGTVAWSVGLRIAGQGLKSHPPRRFGVDDLLPSPVMDQYGIIYVACSFDGLFAIAGRPSGTLANTAWPMFHHDVKHTGKYGAR